MSAKQLEEFIGLIETAERLTQRENALEGKRRSTSSLSSCPTDIFTRRKNYGDSGSSRSPSNSPMRVKRIPDKVSPTHHLRGISEHPQVNHFCINVSRICRTVGINFVRGYIFNPNVLFFDIRLRFQDYGSQGTDPRF